MKKISPLRAAAALTATFALVAATAPSYAATAGQAKPRAAYQLARSLSVRANHLSTSYAGTQYPNYGSTIDAVLALDASHTGQTEAAKATAYIARNIGAYTGTGTESYAGATAKALLLAVAQKAAPAGTLGGKNLKTALLALKAGNGRFSDTSQYGDYSNTFSQSLAVLALRRSGVAVGSAAVNYLLLQQCPGGGFRQDEADTACTDATTADPDSTSIAIEGLAAMAPSTTIKAAIHRAGSYLVSAQRSGGGIASGSLGQNANTNGVAALALRVAGWPTQATRAQTFLGNLMYGCSAPAAIRGLIAYNAANHKANSTGTVLQDLQATSQALQGLANVQYANITKTGAAAQMTGLACVK